MRQTFFDGAVKNFQVVLPDFGTVAGPFRSFGSPVRVSIQTRYVRLQLGQDAVVLATGSGEILGLPERKAAATIEFLRSAR